MRWSTTAIEACAVRAVGVSGFGDPDVLVVETSLIPNPPPGQVLVDVLWRGVSHGDVIVCSGEAVIRSAVSSMVSGRSISDRCSRVLRPVAYTVAPAAPSCTAIWRPAPRVAPATRATFPRNESLVIPPRLVPKPDSFRLDLR
jgi:hypothetical protein